MKIRFFIQFILMSCLFISNVNSKPFVKHKKTTNPALQFEGEWRVDSYDFREFVSVPTDLLVKLKNEAGAFPIGQHISFESIGVVILPGGINPETMKYVGPQGEGLKMTILRPFEHELCERRQWSYLCEINYKEDYSGELMIDGISRWARDASEEDAKIWSDLKLFQYSFLYLGKSYSFNARVARNGDIFIMIAIEGIVKGRGRNPDSIGWGNIGIRLKRIAE